MTQSIVVQVGQCGNQIGSRFWDLALREHAALKKNDSYDDALGNFFRNVDARGARCVDIPRGGPGGDKIKCLKARAVLVDMEEGVVNELMKAPIGEIFDAKHVVSDVSGSGNNWATGHFEYGQKYCEQLREALRSAAELCDCLQCFFLLHSMGGGTGSGLGTFILQLLHDDYPDVYKFVTAVYPSEDDDVITSPYNSVLAMRCLTEFADCVLPIENQALIDIVNKLTESLDGGMVGRGGNTGSYSSTCTKAHASGKPFDEMNNIVANLLLNMTCSSRFEGSLNVDLNEITMNLVPFPSLHYLVSSQTPLYTVNGAHLPLRRLDQVFTDAFAKDNQLLKADPKHGLYLACALMVRGKVELSDLRRNIDRLRPTLRFAHWNSEGWKTGLCAVPPVAGPPLSLLTLANNACVRHTFSDLERRFRLLYKRRAHLHHYSEVVGMDVASVFDESLQSLCTLRSEYERLEQEAQQPPPPVPRLRPF